MRVREFNVIPDCHKQLADMTTMHSRTKARNYLRKCDIKTINTVILIAEIGRRYKLLKIKRPILHSERVLLEWSDYVCISVREPKEHAIEYLIEKKDFFSAYLYGLEMLTYNIA